jgi:hypothetical protein
VDNLRTLPELATLRGSHAIAYYGLIDDEAPQMVYEHLRRLGRVRRLDLVLATHGGSATAARRLALLLHDYTDHLTVLIAHRAWSAGTLLAMAAHELVLGPLAELGPLDPRIGSLSNADSGPSMVSSEDVRAFRRMAEDWFGVDRDEDRLQVLALLAQRVFPPSLGTFYRAEQLTRQLAGELLAYHLPDADSATRQAVVDQLVSGYHAHDYAITRTQARELGLRVTYPEPLEEALIWDVVGECRAQTVACADGEQVLSLVSGTDFRARQIEYLGPPAQARHQGATTRGRDIRWKIG